MCYLCSFQFCVSINSPNTCNRHGESLANKQQLIVASLANGKKEEYSLSEEGKNQARRAGVTLAEKLRVKWEEAEKGGIGGAHGESTKKKVYFYHSPFSRTAATCALASSGSATLLPLFPLNFSLMSPPHVGHEPISPLVSSTPLIPFPCQSLFERNAIGAEKGQGCGR